MSAEADADPRVCPLCHRYWPQYMRHLDPSLKSRIDLGAVDASLRGAFEDVDAPAVPAPALDARAFGLVYDAANLARRAAYRADADMYGRGPPRDYAEPESLYFGRGAVRLPGRREGATPLWFIGVCLVFAAVAAAMVWWAPR